MRRFEFANGRYERLPAGTSSGNSSAGTLPMTEAEKAAAAEREGARAPFGFVAPVPAGKRGKR